MSASHFFYFTQNYSKYFLNEVYTHTGHTIPTGAYIISVLQNSQIFKLAQSNSDPLKPINIPGIGSISYICSVSNCNEYFNDSEINFASMLICKEL
jgi:hypothetical protein